MIQDTFDSDLIFTMEALALETGNDLIIHTAGGTIIGSPMSDDDLNDPSAIKLFFETFKQVREPNIQALNENSEYLAHTKVVYLKDVTIVSAHSITVPFLAVLPEQISGITFGKID